MNYSKYMFSIALITYYSFVQIDFIHTATKFNEDIIQQPLSYYPGSNNSMIPVGETYNQLKTLAVNIAYLDIFTQEPLNSEKLEEKIIKNSNNLECFLTLNNITIDRSSLLILISLYQNTYKNHILLTPLIKINNHEFIQDPNGLCTIIQKNDTNFKAIAKAYISKNNLITTDIRNALVPLQPTINGIKK